MVVLGTAMLSLAVACWPIRPSLRRARALCGPAGSVTRRVTVSPLARTVLLAVPVLSAWLAFGFLIGIALLIVGWTVSRRWRARYLSRRRSRIGVTAAEALSALAGTLRSGVHPAAAAEDVAQECAPEIAGVLHTIAAASRLGGDVERALTRSVNGLPELSAVVSRLGRAWTLVHRHGLPLAETLEAVQRDLEYRSRFANQVQARMAGPRSSAAVLATLPGLGLVLGEAMGARPLHVLLGTLPGQCLLLTGCVLTCAGLLWSAQLTERTVLP